jgi:hypothetical protein
MAQQNRLEEWIHAYLMSGSWANPGLSEGLKRQPRWWAGPLLLPLQSLTRCLGPEPGMEYRVTQANWLARTGQIIRRIQAEGSTPLDLPPLIINDTQGIRSVRDGNHRCGAFERLGWPAAWVLIWYDSREEAGASPYPVVSPARRTA